MKNKIGLFIFLLGILIVVFGCSKPLAGQAIEVNRAYGVEGYSNEGCKPTWWYKDSMGKVQGPFKGCTTQFADVDPITQKPIPWCGTVTVKDVRGREVFISGSEQGTVWKNCEKIVQEQKLDVASCQPIQFSDDSFEKLVKNKLQVYYDYTGQKITTCDVEKITSLEFGVNIKNIEGIQYFSNLKSLDLSFNKIEEITLLQGLKQLEKINLENNKIEDISALKELTNLKELNLRDNLITDLNPLKGLTKLESLSLQGNLISDITQLGNLVNLVYLSVGENQISEIKFLKSLGKISSLYIFDNQLNDLSPLSSMNTLVVLDISHNQITDIGPLKNLKNLKFLYLNNNKIVYLTSFKGLLNLKHLELNENPIQYTPQTCTFLNNLKGSGDLVYIEGADFTKCSVN